ncbi:hypothetical protein ABS768_02255 [Flavobacterium sp. ST-75]|uniref:DUF2007 domain-containing protein n=1 Tax=Flavobacterium rhizophilum TaxID=3163296 RepID=A0ABW8Y9Y8_9FLAO
MKRTFTTLKTFPDLDQAKELKRFLCKNEIRSFLNDNHDSPLGDFEVKVITTDFNSATRLLEEKTEQMVGEVTSDYCLYSFTTPQLYDILVNKDVWSDFDFMLAKKILHEKGMPTDADTLFKLKQEKAKDAAKPEINQIVHILAGYVLALLGGVAGIVIGFLMWNSQKQMPSGISVFSYTEVERKHGRIIFGLGILIFAIVLSLRLRQIPD